MSLRDFINEADKKKKQEVKVDLNTILSDVSNIYNNDDAMVKFLKRISPPSSEKHLKFFYIVDTDTEHGETSVNYNEDNSKQPTREFQQIVDRIKKPKPTEWEQYFDKGLDNINDAARKSYIERYFIPKVRNPARVTKDTKYAEKGIVASEGQYETLGKAMVFYAGKCVSRLTDTDTKIDQAKFKEILQGVFGAAPDQGRENDSFLMQFMTIEPKLKIDAAKNVINSIKQSGTNDNGEQTDEAYSTNLKDVLDFLFEADESGDQNQEQGTGNFVELPQRVEDFSQDIKIALKQAKNVAEKFPKQYKLWHEKLTAAFNRGVKEYQDLERNPDTKEIKNPITGKIEKRHGKAWGLGGPNAFIRNSKVLNKLTDDIKGQKWTIFNCGPKIILGLFDAMEKGGSFYQDICDRMGGGFNQLKHAFKNTRPEDFDKLIKQYRGKDEKEAMGAAYAGVACSLSQLYKLLAYGKIGTINTETCTFNTENGENNIPLIQVYVNNLLTSIKMYTEEEKVYNKWLEDFRAKQQEQINAYEKQLNNQSGNNQENNQENNNQPQQQNNSYKPFSLKNFINEADVKGETKNIDNVKEELEKLKEKNAKAGEIAINSYIAVLDDYKTSVKTIPDIKETFEYLRDKLFDEGRAKDTASRLSNKNNEEDNNQPQQQNNSYKPEFKLKMIDNKLSFNTDIKLHIFEDIQPLEDDDKNDGDSSDNGNNGNNNNNSNNSNNNNNNNNNTDEPNVSENEGNLDWLENGAGKALCKVYEVISENGDSLNINRFKELANVKKEKEAKQNLKKVFGNLVNLLTQVNVMPIKDGIIGMYSNSGELDVTPQNIPGAIEAYGKQKTEEQKPEENKEENKEDQATTNHEENLKKLQELTGANGKLFTEVIAKLNDDLYSGMNDEWFNNYKALIEKTHQYEAEIINVLKAAYGNNENITNIENTVKNSQFLTGIWTTVSAAKRAMVDLNKRVEEDKKKQGQENNQNGQAGNK